MNLLITGGAGFIGSNLIRHIIDRPGISRLINLDCLTYAGHSANIEDASRHPKYAFEQVDLRDKSAVVRVVRQHAITHVVHLAESHVDRSITGPDDSSTPTSLARSTCSKPAAPIGSILNLPSASCMSPPTKSMAASVLQAISRKRLRTLRTHLTPRAKRRATCWSALITIPTD